MGQRLAYDMGIRPAAAYGAGGGGGPVYLSAGRPTYLGNNSGAGTLNPVNWGETAGHQGMVFFAAEAFTTGGPYAFAPTNGMEVINYAEANDGTTFWCVGVGKYTYDGTNNPSLGISIEGGTVNTVFQSVVFYSEAEINVYCPDIAAAIIPGVAYTFGDNDEWGVDGSQALVTAPALPIEDGTDWQQYRILFVGDDGAVSDVDTSYDRLTGVNTISGTDMSFYAGHYANAAVLPSDSSASFRLQQPDLQVSGTGVGAAHVLVGLAA